MTEIQKNALKLLELILYQKERYDKINEDIKVLQPYFPSLINFMDGKTLDKLIKLLDLILDEDLASYFLESQVMEDGGMIVVGKDAFPIKTIKDLEFYLDNRDK